MFFFSAFEQISIYFPILLGAYSSFFLLKIPFLTLETAYLLGSLLSCFINYLKLNSLITLIFCILTSVFAGLIISSITFFVKKYIDISYLLASIIVNGFFHGASQFIAKGVHLTLTNYENVLSIVPSFKFYPQLTTIFFLSLFIFVSFYFFLKTKLGFCFKIYGNNKEFFLNYKISKDYIEYFGVLISGILGAFSGFINTYVNGFYDLGMAFGINLIFITILILGIAVIEKKESLMIPVSGIFIYFFMQFFLLKINFDSKYFTMVQSLIIYLILFFMKKFKGKKYELGL